MNAIKGDVPEHFEIFRTPLSQLHNYNTRNDFLPRLPKLRTEWGRRTTYFRAFTMGYPAVAAAAAVATTTTTMMGQERYNFGIVR